jgi:hypothetical protein
MTSLKPVVLTASGVFLGLILGCGSGDTPPQLPEGPKGSAKAKVSYEGKSISVGTLVLDSGQGYMASAPASADGTFTLK